MNGQQKTSTNNSLLQHSKALARRMRQQWRWIAASTAIIIAIPVVAIIGANAVILPYRQYIVPSNDHQAVRNKHITVGMVFGAGVTSDGKPYKELRSRLDVAAAAMQRGDIQKLIVSGDNRFKNYDEPTAMKQYLVQTYHLAAQDIQPDFAGRSTYESCQRAAQVFGQHQLILFSAGSHLPRALYLCRHFGIESYGVASPIEANNAVRREAQARVKALYNIHIHGESTILGPPIRL